MFSFERSILLPLYNLDSLLTFIGKVKKGIIFAGRHHQTPYFCLVKALSIL